MTGSVYLELMQSLSLVLRSLLLNLFTSPYVSCGETTYFYFYLYMNERVGHKCSFRAINSSTNLLFIHWKKIESLHHAKVRQMDL